MGAGRLVLFHSDLDVTNLFSERLRDGFVSLGYEIFDYDLTRGIQELSRFYQSLDAGLPTAMIGFNSCFYGMQTPSGENVWETLGIPCVNILLDHPYWYHRILTQMPASSIALCIDRNHMAYVNRFYPHIGINGFLPHGGTATDLSPRAMAERSIDVLYAGSLYQKDSISLRPDFRQWDFPAEEIYEETFRQLLEETQCTVEGALEQQLLRHGVSLSDTELRLFINACVAIERVVSSHYREKILALIARAGIPLTLYGLGWDECGWISLPNVQYGGRIAPEEILKLMGESRLVLNTMPWFKDGSHERIFNAMLNGAVPVTESNPYLCETLLSESWVPYELREKSLAQLPERLKDLLAHPEHLQQMADAGYADALAHHTWAARAAELHTDLLSRF